MRRFLLPLLLLLAACGREAPAPVEAVSFRDRSVPIASTTRGTLGDLGGEWVVSAAYPGGDFGAAPRDVITIYDYAGASASDTWLFSPADRVGWVMFPVEETGPGRYRLGHDSTPELWVLWTDEDFRTAVIGTPDGTFGWIMDRPGAASPDRTRAAREVLDFNGYDVARLSS